MNSNHCSKLLTLLLAVALVASAVAPAAAVSAEASDAPEKKRVGEEVKSTFTLTELYTDYEQWTLNGRTNLSEVTWTVRMYDQAGNKVNQKSYDGQSFNKSVNVENDVAEVRVTLEGTVAEVEDFSYDTAKQQTLLAEFNQVRKGGNSQSIDSWQFRPYTDESAAARQAIADAEDAIDEAESAGASVSEAKNTLDSAVSAFDHENFANAEKLAGDAKKTADSAQKSNQQTQMLLYGGAGLLALVVVVGGVLWYRSQQDSYDKLR
ncbi:MULTISPECIES: hypothetical protein [Halorussus]|uniref:hypothetical protein n=1 Tax=Halorussus TaxID=1070314 RepID=UPI0020A18545|nr:hypothetical protein [Halorussus vallis]USZ77527.1 hypothetical protein NGM07_09365 [Halorussus vallis]